MTAEAASSGTDFCRSCRARVRWLNNATTGKRAPINAEPVVAVAPIPNGNIVVDLQAGTYQVLAGPKREQAIAEGVALHLNHFVTCEHAPAWKKRQASRG